MGLDAVGMASDTGVDGGSFRYDEHVAEQEMLRSDHQNETIRGWVDAAMDLLAGWDWQDRPPDQATTLYVVECDAEQFYADALADGLRPADIVDMPLALRVLAVHFWASGGRRIKDR